MFRESMFIFRFGGSLVLSFSFLFVNGGDDVGGVGFF